MGKRLVEAPLTTRSARAGLAEGLHWRRLDPDVHLGYRKGKRGGVWLVRWRVGAGYHQEALGAADDSVKEGTLSFEDARRRAIEHVNRGRAAAKAAADGPAPTVRSAADAYIAAYEHRTAARTGREDGRKPARGQLTRHVLGDVIADVALHELTRDDLTAWRKRMAGKGLAVATVRRVSNDFRAALNAAAAEHHKRLPGAFPLEVKAGLAATEQGYSPVAREAQVLTDADVRSIVAVALAHISQVRR